MEVWPGGKEGMFGEIGRALQSRRHANTVMVANKSAAKDGAYMNPRSVAIEQRLQVQHSMNTPSQCYINSNHIQKTIAIFNELESKTFLR